MRTAPLSAQIALLILVAALAISVVTDLRQRKILNRVTYPAFLAMAACIVWRGGPILLFEGALGAIVCAVPLLLLSLRSAMGEGDVKLMALCGLTAGAAGGWSFALTLLAHVAIAGGIQALLWIAVALLRKKPRPRSVPYALSIAAGTASAFLGGLPVF